MTAAGVLSSKHKRVFPLLSQAFDIDIVIPKQRSVYKWNRESTAGERKVAEAFVAEVSLTNIDTIAVFRKRTVDTVVTEGHVCRARAGAGFQSRSKKQSSSSVPRNPRRKR